MVSGTRIGCDDIVWMLSLSMMILRACGLTGLGVHVVISIMNQWVERSMLYEASVGRIDSGIGKDQDISRIERVHDIHLHISTWKVYAFTT